MASGDELVYRLILDSQDNTSAPTGGSGSSNGGTRPKHPADEAQANQLALQMAKSRIDRESMLTLADQQYRSIKTGKRLTTIQDEDHQAKLDRSEAEAQRQRDAMAKVAAREEKAAQAALARQQRQEERERQQFERKVQAEAREAERQRVAKIRAEDQQHRDESAYDRDMLQQKKLKEQEARRLQDAKNANDPNYLAAEALKREKLYEATRLRVEGAKRGMTPDEVEREERARASARNAAGYGHVMNSALGNILGGNSLGLIGNMASLNPIVGAVLQPILAGTEKLRGWHNEMTDKLKISGRFSPAVMIANMQNRQAEIRQDIDISNKHGEEIADRMKEKKNFELMKKQAESDISMGPAGQFARWLTRELNLMDLGTLRIAAGDLGKPQPTRDALIELGKKIEETKRKEALKRPDPFEFRVHRIGQIPVVGNALKVPFVKPNGLANPQMPGG